ncbi:MAG: hypothetical protein GY696_24505 [Gammaproteobacteria bacterium]|nr:hypothetical protein [Gammaproteobacteria bacterium]
MKNIGPNAFNYLTNIFNRCLEECKIPNILRIIPLLKPGNPTVKKAKILGITFDNVLSFKQHTSELKIKLQKNNILHALSGSYLGKEKEVGQYVQSYWQIPLELLLSNLDPFTQRNLLV